MQHPNLNREPHPQNNPFVRPGGASRPIHKLPFELLLRTFEFGTAYNDRPIRAMSTTYKYERPEEAAGEEWAPESHTNTRHAPPFHVIVSHVCRYWRDVALSTASLWTDIRLFVGFARPPYRLVSVQLERSKHLPIDVTIYAHAYESETAFSDAKLLYALLIPHVSRWRSIDIRGAESRHMSAFLAAVAASPSSASHLESLRLQHYIHDVGVYLGDPTLMEFQTLFNGSAPRLKHLKLDTVHVNWSQTFISAASNLTSLELFHHIRPIRPSWTEFTTILRGAPRLQKLALHQSGPSGHPEIWEPVSTGTNPAFDLNDPPIPLLHLTELVLGSQPEAAAIALLRNLYMPVLTTLILDLDAEDYSHFVDELTGPATSLARFSSENPPSSLLTRLERLAILNLACEDDELMVVMFKKLENLKALRISATRGLLLLQHLIPPTPAPLEHDVVMCDLPQLESLIVCPSRGNVPLLRKLVQRRKDGGTPLKSLYVSRNEKVERVEVEWFREQLETFWFVDDLHCWDTERAFEGDW